MKVSPVLLLVLSFVAVVSAIPPMPTEAGELIENSCRLTSTFDGRFTKEFCITSIYSGVPIDPKAKMSMHELAGIGLDLLMRNVSATRDKIDLMLKGPNTPDMKDYLEHCLSMYNEAHEKAEDALKDMKKEKYTEADRRVSMIQGDGSECESEFTQKPGLPSPLTPENLNCEYLSGMTTLLIRFFDKTYTPWGTAILKP